MKGTITKRGPKTYLLRLFLGRDSKTGKQIRKGKTVHGTRKEAESKLREWVTAYENGALLSDEKLSLSDFIAHWLDAALKSRVSERTFDQYRKDLERYLLPEIGHLPISKISALDIQTVYAKLSDKGLSPATVKAVHAPLNQAFKAAVRWRKVAVNPCGAIDLPKRKKVRDVNPMNAEQANEFLEACILTPWAALFEFALSSGMRPGEYLGLSWCCVDFNECTARVEKAVKRPRGRVPFLGPPKTAAGRRTITLPKEVMDQLRDHRITQNEERLRAGSAWDSSLNLVFPGPDGKIWDEANFRRVAFDRVCQLANLEGFTPYSLRHTCATLLLLDKEHPRIVAERLGHSTTSITMDTYSHVLPSMQASASGKLARILYGTKGR